MIVSQQRTFFLFLMVIGVSNVRCETSFKTGEFASINFIVRFTANCT